MTATPLPAERLDRRIAMAAAATTIVARDGLRSLTHRAVDRELGLPSGSTSYYLRTRRDLVEAMVRRLADRTIADVASDPPPTAAAAPRSVAEVSAGLAALLDRLAERPDDHLARWALTVDLTHDEELHAYLTSRSPVRARLVERAQELLSSIGAEDPDAHASGLVALVDGLLFDRLAGSGRSEASPTDAAAVLHAYLSGLPRASSA